MTDNKRPTTVEIASEVEKLKAMTPKIRHFTAFGDNNREAVRVDILVLEKGLSEDEIYMNWENDRSTLDSALGARSWLDGNERDRPSSNWESLVVD